MNEFDVRNLSDEQLADLIADLRAEVIRRIDLMADAAGLSVSYNERSAKRRGRPSKNTSDGKGNS